MDAFETFERWESRDAFTVRREVRLQTTVRKVSPKGLKAYKILRELGFQGAHAWPLQWGGPEAKEGLFWAHGTINKEVQTRVENSVKRLVKRANAANLKTFATVTSRRYIELNLLESVTYRIDIVDAAGNVTNTSEITIYQRLTQSERDALVAGKRIDIEPKRLFGHEGNVIRAQNLDDTIELLRKGSVDSRATGKNAAGTSSRGTSPDARATGAKKKAGAKLTSSTGQPAHAKSNVAPSTLSGQAAAQKPALKGLRRMNIDLSRIKINVGKALRVGKAAAGGLGKGLVVGAVVGVLEDLALSALTNWMFRGVDEATLKRLEKERGPEIERLSEQAVESHVRKLSRQGGVAYKIVVEFRLVYMRVPTQNFVLDDMLVDKAYVSEHGYEGCQPGNVNRDLKGYTKLLAAEENLKVVKCRKVIEFEYPDVGAPSIEGDWTEYYLDKTEPGKEFPTNWAFKVEPISDGDRTGTVLIVGRHVSGTSRMTTRKATWDGHTLDISAVQHSKTAGTETYLRYLLSFTEWDILKGSLFYGLDEYHVYTHRNDKWDTIWRRASGSF